MSTMVVTRVNAYIESFPKVAFAIVVGYFCPAPETGKPTASICVDIQKRLVTRNMETYVEASSC
jgi:hypothetical protein